MRTPFILILSAFWGSNAFADMPKGQWAVSGNVATLEWKTPHLSDPSQVETTTCSVKYERDTAGDSLEVTSLQENLPRWALTEYEHPSKKVQLMYLLYDTPIRADRGGLAGYQNYYAALRTKITDNRVFFDPTTNGPKLTVIRGETLGYRGEMVPSWTDSAGIAETESPCIGQIRYMTRGSAPVEKVAKKMHEKFWMFK